MPDYETTDSGLVIPKSRRNKNDNAGETEDGLVSSLQKSTRGDPIKDPLANQKFSKRKVHDLGEKQVHAIMDTSWLADIIVDDYSEKATRSGAGVKVKETENVSDNIASEIEEAINEWIKTRTFGKKERDIFAVMQEQVEFERSTGEGYIVPITREVGETTWDEPMPSRLISIDDLNTFGKYKISDRKKTDHVLSSGHNELDWIKIEVGENGSMIQQVHPSRFTALISRKMRSEDTDGEGLSVFRRMHMILKSMINTEWSVGQIIYSMVFKVLKTDLSSLNDRRQRETANRMFEKYYNALSLALVGKNDELEVKGLGQGMAGAEAVFDFLKDLVSAATKFPKSVLFGDQAGFVSGAKQDETNLVARLMDFQSTYLSPQLRWLIEIGLRASDEIEIPKTRDGIRVVRPGNIMYSVEWNDIFDLDEREVAEVEKTRAETKQIESNVLRNAVAMGILNRQEAAERFNLEELEDDSFQEAKKFYEDNQEEIEELFQ